ncbi:MAG: metallophosphoesterase, partial [Ignavibacteriaceae bacterium]
MTRGQTLLPVRSIYLTAVLFLFVGFIYSSFAQTQTVFAVVGDMGSNNSNEQDVVDLIDSWNPSYVWTVGDNVYTDSYPKDVGKYYHQYMYPHDPTYGKSTDPTSNKFWPVVGNHDWDVNDLDDYLNYFELPGNERYYNQKIGDIEFFTVDSDSREPDGTSENSKQGKWLQQQLSISTALWKIVLFHHPAYSSGGSNSNMQWSFENWGVDAVLSGHVHNYERIERDDNHDGDSLLYFVNGLGGESEKGFGSSTVSGSRYRYSSSYGAMKITETEDGINSTLTFEFYNVSGTFKDGYTMQKPIPLPVELMAFSVVLVGNSSVKLNWSTATEVNNYGFDVERSNGSNNWLKIGFVAGSGNSNSPKNYSFVDNPTGGSLFNYRLKQIDIGGNFKYYDAIPVKLLALSSPQLLQNNP